VAGILAKALEYAGRPTTEFNKYELLQMLETLQNTARDTKHEKSEYYQLAYQSARNKIDIPHEHFRSLALRLLGNKDHQRVFEAVSKVEKAMAKTTEQYRSDTPQRGRRQIRDQGARRCYYCNKQGHVWARCLARKAAQRNDSQQGKKDTGDKK